MGLEVGLAHSIEVALGLLGASFDLAHPGFGSMALAETLRLDYVGAAFDAAVSALVLQLALGGIVRGAVGEAHVVPLLSICEMRAQLWKEFSYVGFVLAFHNPENSILVAQ